MAAAQQEDSDSYLLPDKTDDVLAFLDKIGTSAAVLPKKPKKPKPAQAPRRRRDYSDSYSDSYSYSYDRRRPQKIKGNVIPGVTSPRVRMVEEFMQQTEASGDWLQQWYAENYEKVQNYEYVRYELLYFLNDHMTGIYVDENIDPVNLVELVKELVMELSTKFNKFNLQLREISGHEVAGHIQSHRRKVLEVVEDYENKLKEATAENAQLREHIAHLDAELTAARQRLMYVERGTAYYGNFEDSLSEGQFMADLKSRVAHSQSLNSSMKEELEREKQENVGLKRELAQFNRDKVETEEQCMREIVELSKRAEINSMVQHGIEAVLKGGDKAPNAEDCQNIIDNWKTEINQAIDHNSKEISELLKKIEEQSQEMATLEAQALEMDDKIEAMKIQVQNKKSLFDKYREEARALQAQVDDFKQVMEELHHESFGLRSFLGRNREGPGSSEEDLDMTNQFVGPIGGEVAEHDMLADTLPLRWGRRRRRRRRPEPSLSTSGSYEEDTTPEDLPMPQQGLGMIRITGEDEWEAVAPEGPSGQAPALRGPIRLVDGQWREVQEASPMTVPLIELPADPRLMRPMRLDQMGWPPVGDNRLGGGPIEQAQAGMAMRLVNGQWVAQQASPPPQLQSTLRSPVRGAIPTRAGPNVSRIPSRSPRATAPRNLQTAGMRPAAQRPGTPPRQDAPGVPLSVPRAGTAQSLRTSGLRPPTARAPGMRPTATRPGTPPRPGGSTQRPTATRPGTAARPGSTTLGPAATRPRVTQRSAGPGVRQTAPRARTTQRQGASYMHTGASTQTDPLSARVVLLSPHRLQPLPLDVDLAAQNIVPGQNEFLAEVAVGVHPATPESGRGRRSRRPRPHFTPRTLPR